jgi:NTF2 fold immunity protein
MGYDECMAVNPISPRSRGGPRMLIPVVLVTSLLSAAGGWAIHDLTRFNCKSDEGARCGVVGNDQAISSPRGLTETVPHNYKPPDGYVADAGTAIKIAVAVWEPIYGADHIAGEQPYQANLTNGVWTVEGSLPKGWLGGVAVAEIAKDDGKVLRVSHGK